MMIAGVGILDCLKRWKVENHVNRLSDYLYIIMISILCFFIS